MPFGFATAPTEIDVDQSLGVQPTVAAEETQTLSDEAIDSFLTSSPSLATQVLTDESIDQFLGTPAPSTAGTADAELSFQQQAPSLAKRVFQALPGVDPSDLPPEATQARTEPIGPITEQFAAGAFEFPLRTGAALASRLASIQDTLIAQSKELGLPQFKPLLSELSRDSLGELEEALSEQPLAPDPEGFSQTVARIAGQFAAAGPVYGAAIGVASRIVGTASILHLALAEGMGFAAITATTQGRDIDVHEIGKSFLIGLGFPFARIPRTRAGRAFLTGAIGAAASGADPYEVGFFALLGFSAGSTRALTPLRERKIKSIATKFKQGKITFEKALEIVRKEGVLGRSELARKAPRLAAEQITREAPAALPPAPEGVPGFVRVAGRPERLLGPAPEPFIPPEAPLALPPAEGIQPFELVSERKPPLIPAEAVRRAELTARLDRTEATALVEEKIQSIESQAPQPSFERIDTETQFLLPETAETLAFPERRLRPEGEPTGPLLEAAREAEARARQVDIEDPTGPLALEMEAEFRRIEEAELREIGMEFSGDLQDAVLTDLQFVGGVKGDKPGVGFTIDALREEVDVGILNTTGRGMRFQGPGGGVTRKGKLIGGPLRTASREGKTVEGLVEIFNEEGSRVKELLGDSIQTSDDVFDLLLNTFPKQKTIGGIPTTQAAGRRAKGFPDPRLARGGPFTFRDVLRLLRGEGFRPEELATLEAQKFAKDMELLEGRVTEAADQARREIPREPLEIEELAVAELNQAKVGRRLFTPLKRIFNIRGFFNDKGAPKTGASFWRWFSTIDTHQEKALGHIRAVRKANLTQPEEVQAIIASQIRSEFNRSSPKVQKEATRLRKYMDEYLKKFKIKEGLEKGFIERWTEDLEATLASATENTPEIQNARDLLGQLKSGAIQFTHHPTAIWLRSYSDRNPRGASRVLRLSVQQKRTKALTLLDLIDPEGPYVTEGLIEPNDIRLSDVYASYGFRSARDFALLDVRNSAKADGLIVKGKREGFISPDPHVIRRMPAFAGHSFKPWFLDYLVDWSENAGRYHRLGWTLSSVKMAQFWNPLFLPAYDIHQAWALGSINPLRPIKGGANAVKAARSMLFKDSHYWDAAGEGAFAKPFSPPWADFWQNARRTREGGSLLNFVKGLSGLEKVEGKKLPRLKKIPVLGELYRASWFTAWKLDNAIRMHSYHHLRSKGFSPAEAAEEVALAHGNYANVPPQTRKTANILFFTPTFKIAMIGDWYAQLIKGSFDALARPVKTLRGQQPREALKLRTLMTIAATTYAVDHLLVNAGLKREVFGIKYVGNQIDTEDGPKDVVVNIPSPLTLWSKYPGRAKLAIENKGFGASAALMFLSMNRWEIQPLYRITSDLIDDWANQRGQIITPSALASPGQQEREIALYLAREFTPMLKSVLGETPRRGGLSQEELLKADLPKILEIMTSLRLAFAHKRSPADRRAYGAISGIIGQMKRAARQRKLTPQLIENVGKSIQREIERLQEERGSEIKMKGFSIPAPEPTIIPFPRQVPGPQG